MLARTSDGSFSNPNVVTGEDNAFGVLKLQLTHNSYSRPTDRCPSAGECTGQPARHGLELGLG
jgi:hypothetical protein